MSDWIEWTWTEEKPYPETLETFVYIKCEDGYDDSTLDIPAATVGFWHEGEPNDSGWFKETAGRITHYRLA